MTILQERAIQLDELKPFLGDVTYHCAILSRTGTFKPIETFCFATMEEAREKYNELVKPRGPYYPGFLRLFATVTF